MCLKKVDDRRCVYRESGRGTPDRREWFRFHRQASHFSHMTQGEGIDISWNPISTCLLGDKSFQL